MNFETWEPIYEAICADFGFDRAVDQHARDVLKDLVDPFDTDRLAVADATVAIVGGADLLEADLELIREVDAIFATSSAASKLSDYGRSVDCICTDLDSVPSFVRDRSRSGIPVVVHAHGDNVDELEKWVPTMAIENILGTTQVAPAPPIINVGGFTDGDRAAFLADHLNAERLVFPGWDFEDPTVPETKRQKLVWAARLLAWLERQRNEQFAVLDNVRKNIDLSDVLNR